MKVQLTDKYTLTSKSMRTVDANGYLHVKDNRIAKEGVYPYLGRELGKDLIPNQVYYVYKPYEELKKAMTDSQLPVHAQHKWITPENKTTVHGSLTGMREGRPFIKGDIALYKQEAIDMVNKDQCELSMGFTCDIEDAKGEFEGQKYDFIQRNINFNHVAIVPDGRCGSDVRINDERGVLMDERSQIEDNPIVAGVAGAVAGKAMSKDEEKEKVKEEEKGKETENKEEPQPEAKGKDKECGKAEKKKATDEDEDSDGEGADDSDEDGKESEETKEKFEIPKEQKEKKVGDMYASELLDMLTKHGTKVTVVEPDIKEKVEVTDAAIMKQAVKMVSDSYKALDEVAPYVGKFEVVTNDSVMTVDEIYKHALKQVGFDRETADPKGVFDMYLQTKGISKQSNNGISESQIWLDEMKSKGF